MPREWAWIRDPNNWYWIVGADSPPSIYSSASGGFVQENDAAYQGWLASGHVPATIASVSELGSVLSDLSAPPPVDATASSAYKDALIGKIDMVMLRVLFNHENRIRALNNQQAVTAQQFLTAIKSLL